MKSSVVLLATSLLCCTLAFAAIQISRSFPTMQCTIISKPRARL